MIKGIDISHWQGKVDFPTVKNQGFDFVMIRAAAGNKNGILYLDNMFETYYQAAKAAGMNIGAYFYASGLFHEPGRGRKEAEYFYNIIKGKTFEYPVALDIECSPAGYNTATTQNAIVFCEYLENLGYYVVIYASDISGFKSRLNLASLTAYDKWVARYNTSGPQIVQDWGIWQFGGSTNYLANVKVQGVESAACDQNYSRKDYATIIKNAGLNGFKNESVKLYKFVSGYVTKGDLESYIELAEKQGVPYTAEEVV